MLRRCLKTMRLEVEEKGPEAVDYGRRAGRETQGYCVMYLEEKLRECRKREGVGLRPFGNFGHAPDDENEELGSEGEGEKETCDVRCSTATRSVHRVRRIPRSRTSCSWMYVSELLYSRSQCWSVRLFVRSIFCFRFWLFEQ